MKLNELKLNDEFGTPSPTLKRFLEPLRLELRRRRYSRRTIGTYLAFNRRFLKFIRKAPGDVIAADVRAFLDDLSERDVSAATLNLAISGLKIFYEELLNKHVFKDIVRPRRSRALPLVLSLAEVRALIDAPANAKHRALLAVAYSAGLRVSEAVALRWSDLDRQRTMIFIRQAKGQKDRYSLLSRLAIDYLDAYASQSKQRPSSAGWIFPGQDPGRHLSARSAEKIFENAARIAGIRKKVSFHSLRHAFATHLLESGVDIRYIQKLLGHRSTRTTQIYTHVSRTKLFEIPSPLDGLALPPKPGSIEEEQ